MVSAPIIMWKIDAYPYCSLSCSFFLFYIYNDGIANLTKKFDDLVLNLKMMKSIDNKILKEIHSLWLIKTELLFFVNQYLFFLSKYLFFNEIYCKSISYLTGITIWYSRFLFWDYLTLSSILFVFFSNFQRLLFIIFHENECQEKKK